jgi:hypothetical protein
MASAKRPGKPHFTAAKETIRVMTVKLKGNSVIVVFSARRKEGAEGSCKIVADEKHPLTFECSSPEHADVLAKHCTKLHARTKKSGLVWTIKSLADDIDKLAAARVRSAKMKGRREKDRQERAEIRRMLELRRQKMEQQISKL